MDEEKATVVSEGSVPDNASDDAKQPKKPLKVFLDYALTIGITALVCFLFIRFVGVRSVVEGGSMEPMLQDRDNLFLEKVSYYFHDPERFDIIVFELESEPGEHYIKRVIGLPGETVQITDGVVYINGEILAGDIYCDELIERAYLARSPITLKEDEFFVLGDNRNNSRDSRSASVGPIHRSQILGKAVLRFWPITKITLLGK
ncbi:MAG: signal peptidase I [Lachnospiraceae bacterium]|nr:signal peptidase I [Lachnospiraceae bacterium]